jgi:hypothetical protein
MEFSKDGNAAGKKVRKNAATIFVEHAAANQKKEPDILPPELKEVAKAVQEIREAALGTKRPVDHGPGRALVG